MVHNISSFVADHKRTHISIKRGFQALIVCAHTHTNQWIDVCTAEAWQLKPFQEFGKLFPYINILVNVFLGVLFFLIGLVSWTAIFWGQKVYAFFAVRAISCLNSEWCSFIIYHWKATAIWSFTAEGQSNASNLNQGKSHDFWRGRRICLQRRFSHARGNRFSRPRKRRCFRHCCNQSAAAFGKWGQQTVLIGASYTS